MAIMKPQIYKVGDIWVVWVPGVRVYRFESWLSALNHVLNSAAHESPELSMRAPA
ncbi:MAG TPA: hypothetical protein VK604_00660 [Bryobacteraceae bacterium]|nr:hypothetical protein [Bryobacteraceae bacterium]